MEEIKNILKNAKNLALYGASTNREKDSYKVMEYLQKNGYQVFPINSLTDQKYILGERVYKKLEEIDIDVDILNIFRPSFEILEISKKVIKKNNFKTVWLQLGIFCFESKKILEENGINFIYNKCTKKEHLNHLIKINL